MSNLERILRRERIKQQRAATAKYASFAYRAVRQITGKKGYIGIRGCVYSYLCGKITYELLERVLIASSQGRITNIQVMALLHKVQKYKERNVKARTNNPSTVSNSDTSINISGNSAGPETSK